MREDRPVTAVSIEKIGVSLACYRLRSPRALECMRRSLARYGQLSPVVAFESCGRIELIDGFKRLEAARQIGSLSSLSVRLIECDEQGAKAAIYLLNRVGGRTSDLEEAWIVEALVRHDGLSQLEVAALLGRHKSWVCRRLALVERLSEEAQEALQLGFLSTTSARHIQRLPRGNQGEFLEALRRESLSTQESARLVDAFLASATRPEQKFLLSRPREALSRLSGERCESYDPRLSPAGNRLRKRAALLLDLLPRMEEWLRLHGRADLSPGDVDLLEPLLERIAGSARAVAEAIDDFSGCSTELVR